MSTQQVRERSVCSAEGKSHIMDPLSWICHSLENDGLHSASHIAGLSAVRHGEAMRPEILDHKMQVLQGPRDSQDPEEILAIQGPKLLRF